MVRKILDPMERLSEVVSLKLRPADKAAWAAKVASSGMSASEYFRQAVLCNSTVVIQKPKVDRKFLLFLGLYARLAHQLEDLARAALADRDLGHLSSEDYQDLIHTLIAVLDAFRRELDHAA